MNGSIYKVIQTAPLKISKPEPGDDVHRGRIDDDMLIHCYNKGKRLIKSRVKTPEFKQAADDGFGHWESEKLDVDRWGEIMTSGGLIWT